MAGRREYNGEDISEKPWRVKHWELWGEVSPGALLRVWCGEARLGVAGLSGSRDPPPPPAPGPLQCPQCRRSLSVRACLHFLNSECKRWLDKLGNYIDDVLFAR